MEQLNFFYRIGKSDLYFNFYAKEVTTDVIEYKSLDDFKPSLELENEDIFTLNVKGKVKYNPNNPLTYHIDQFKVKDIYFLKRIK